MLVTVITYFSSQSFSNQLLSVSNKIQTDLFNLQLMLPYLSSVVREKLSGSMSRKSYVIGYITVCINKKLQCNKTLGKRQENRKESQL